MASRRKIRPRASRPGPAAPATRWRGGRWTAAGVVIAALVGAAVFAFWPGRAQADLRPVPRQNVLLVTIDTLRADALSCYGGAAATPALDALAREGVRFTFAHAHAVLTLPSHTS